MENASKALIMAGSLLISLLIIGALVFMYNQFADVQQTKTDVDEEGKLGNLWQRIIITCKFTRRL